MFEFKSIDASFFSIRLVWILVKSHSLRRIESWNLNTLDSWFSHLIVELLQLVPLWVSSLSFSCVVYWHLHLSLVLFLRWLQVWLFAVKRLHNLLLIIVLFTVLDYHLVVFCFIFNRAIVLKITSRLTTEAFIKGGISGGVLDLILLLLLLSGYLFLVWGLKPLLSKGLVDHVELLVAFILFL